MLLDKALFNQKTALLNYHSDVWRMVETQEAAATLNVVDTIEEQGLLENLLDSVKPPYRAGTEKMHYLLKTAFRYPPLKYGSRFGTRLMPSYFYASEQLKTSLAENAYYRFIFLQDMRVEYTHSFQSRHCLFSVNIRSQSCLDLTTQPFEHLQSELTSTVNYSYCQRIGEWAGQRDDIEMIRFESARTLSACNVAVLEPSAIKAKQPKKQQAWLCLTNNQTVSFSSRESKQSYTFSINEFMHDNEFSRPSDN